MSRFEGLKRNAPGREPLPPLQPEPEKEKKAQPSRTGKKAVCAYFSPAVSKGLRQLAAERDTNIQALLGEAIDLLMRHYGKHPFGER